MFIWNACPNHTKILQKPEFIQYFKNYIAFNDDELIEEIKISLFFVHLQLLK